VVQADCLFTSTHSFVKPAANLFTYFFGELNRLATYSETEERNLLPLMQGPGQTLCREATAAGEKL